MSVLPSHSNGQDILRNLTKALILAMSVYEEFGADVLVTTR